MGRVGGRSTRSTARETWCIGCRSGRSASACAGGGGGGEGARRWSSAPIDGTGTLVHRLPLWAISIGLIEAGEPVLGVIAIPPLGELFWAVKGGGAWRDGERLRARDATEFHN